MGVERLLELMQHAQQAAARVTDVYLVHQGSAAARYAFGVAEALPTNNNITLIDMDLRRMRW
jgi:histidyl-tRNA synthetase